jgi:phosphoenolpyruvate carboxylase
MDQEKFRTEIQEVLKKYPGIKSVTIKAVAQYDISIETENGLTKIEPLPQQNTNEIPHKNKKEEVVLDQIMSQLEVPSIDFLKTDLSRPELKSK